MNSKLTHGNDRRWITAEKANASSCGTYKDPPIAVSVAEFCREGLRSDPGKAR
jgi:hypothetical protein